ncbi:MAG: hypothetical protein JW778_01080 [Candidatus Altiarchaeota archaeon]|nr:hypothetical protein [Candidatus Altiarchaeota archaeon]
MKKSRDHRFILLISVILILTVQANSQSPPSCTMTLSVRFDPIDPGEDNEFSVQLNPVPVCRDKPVRLEVIDPNGVRHQYYGITDISARIPPAGYLSYLKQFDNMPNTDVSGRYYVIATLYTGDWVQDDFAVNVICDEQAKDGGGTLIAERQITIGSIPETVASDIVACTDLNANCGYLDLVLDKDCAQTGGSFPGADLNVGTTEPSSTDHITICTKPLPSSELEYTSIDGNKYTLIGMAAEDSDSTHYWMAKTGDDECIMGDVTRCELLTKRLFIDEPLYRDYIRDTVNGLAYVNPPCSGFYEAAVGWLYDIDTPRYHDIFGDLTDFLYCHQSPLPSFKLIKESQWCHLINLGWYSVVNLTNKEGVTNIVNDSITAENRWNNLSGYIVLGHACPIWRDVDNLPAGLQTFDATAGGYNVPCQLPDSEPFTPPCSASIPNQCIYVWTSSYAWDGLFGYEKSFDYTLTNAAEVEVLMADSNTDTQIPAFDVIKEEVESIRSRVTVTPNMVASDCGAVAPITDVFYYDNPLLPGYRSCDDHKLGYYRLFDQDTVWTKIFAVTPMLEDEHWAWDWDWSKASGPDVDSTISIYIGGGCKRTSAFYFNYPGAKSKYFDSASGTNTPIVDYVDVTVDDGVNPPKIYSHVPGRNLLPFPPADAVEDEITGLPIPARTHPYEGIRYSFFKIDHVLPEDAAYLKIDVEYTCETKLERTQSPVCGGGTETIEDESIVSDSYTIKFLDHDNPRENCRWNNPLEWMVIEGTWQGSLTPEHPGRFWDADLEKNIFHLEEDSTQNRRMVSVEEVEEEGKIIEALVRGEASGDQADMMVGFYSDAAANNYWYVDIARDGGVGGQSIVIGRYEAPSSWQDKEYEISPVQPPDEEKWYWVKVFLDGDDIYAKAWLCDPPDPWECSKDEPAGWMIQYEMQAGDTKYGHHWVIGTDIGDTGDEEFWFDTEPMCGIDISGYFTPHDTPLGYAVITDGFIDINIKPDTLSGFNVSFRNTSIIYEQTAYPAKHILYKKGKPEIPPEYPDIFEFYYEDKYGYESEIYGFNELCNLPPCPANCHCEENDIFKPECDNVDRTKGSWHYYPDGCICAPSECYPDPCSSDRTYHEFEGLYYDFVDFNAMRLSKEEEYLQTVMDADVADGETAFWIEGRDLKAELDVGKINSAEGRYRLYFSGTNVKVTDFKDDAQIIVSTHFRNYTYKLKDVLRPRGKAVIAYTVTPPKEFIKTGDIVTIDLDLICGATTISNAEVEVIIPNYEGELFGVRWEKPRIELEDIELDFWAGPVFMPTIKPDFRVTGDRSYVTTDGTGHASFGLMMKQKAAHVILYYEGGDLCSEAEASFILGREDLSSIITSVDFILLLIIFILLIFSYRWFKRGRLDFYEMWQEFRGEKD